MSVHLIWLNTISTFPWPLPPPPICQDVSLDMIDVSPARCHHCHWKYFRKNWKMFRLEKRNETPISRGDCSRRVGSVEIKDYFELLHQSCCIIINNVFVAVGWTFIMINLAIVNINNSGLTWVIAPHNSESGNLDHISRYLDHFFAKRVYILNYISILNLVRRGFEIVTLKVQYGEWGWFSAKPLPPLPPACHPSSWVIINESPGSVGGCQDNKTNV